MTPNPDFKATANICQNGPSYIVRSGQVYFFNSRIKYTAKLHNLSTKNNSFTQPPL